jgi:hypothetical protein
VLLLLQVSVNSLLQVKNQPLQLVGMMFGRPTSRIIRSVNTFLFQSTLGISTMSMYPRSIGRSFHIPGSVSPLSTQQLLFLVRNVPQSAVMASLPGMKFAIRPMVVLLSVKQWKGMNVSLCMRVARCTHLLVPLSVVTGSVLVMRSVMMATIYRMTVRQGMDGV